MGLQKNISGQKWVVFAFTLADNIAKTGDAAQITANLRIDGAAANAVDDTNPAELEDGYYVFDLTQAETNGDLIVICPASSTSGVQVIGVPGSVWTDQVTPKLPTNYIMGSSVVTDKDDDIDAILVDTGTTLDDLVDDIESLLGNATYGLSALKTLIDAVPTVAEIQAEMEENGASVLDTVRDTLGTGGAGLTAVPWNATWDAEVQSEVTDALNAYDPPTKAELDSGLAALNDITVAEIIAGVADGSLDLQEMLRIIFAACAGKSDGGGTATIHFRDSGDSTNRITATVDADGNRSAVTVNGS